MNKSFKVTKGQLIVVILTIIYMILFLTGYLFRKNYEFLIYIIFQTIVILLIIKLHYKYNFSTGVLAGLSFWGFLHMAGGYFIVSVNGAVLYSLQLIPVILRYDQFVHALGFGFATLFSYYLLKQNIKEDFNKLTIFIFLVFIGMGLGALNEIVEFSAVLILKNTGVGDYYNNMWDLVFNTIGAIIAVVYINYKKLKN